MSSGAETSLRGVLERIIFSNAETQFCVGELRPDKQRSSVTITGVLPQVQCGETLELRGCWETHRQHGEQFKVTSCRSSLPATVYGIRKYLGSGLVPGIGKVYADKIVDTFGAKTLDIISEDSGRLREVPGIGPKRAREIKASWDSQQAYRSLMIFLQTYGVGVRNCLRLIKKYGGEAEAILRNEPYRVAREIDGIGFKTADQIARNLGFGNASPERIDAGLVHLLKEMEKEGHTGLPQAELIERAAELLEVDPEPVAARIPELERSGELTAHPKEGEFWQLRYLARAEERIGQAVKRLCSNTGQLPPIHIDRAITWAEEQSGFGFAPEQAQAIRMALESKLSILTGGPGTGKTTILQALVRILKAKKTRILLAAPTGRAAQRMTETTGHRASTLHRLLKFDPAVGSFTMNEDRPLNADFIIVDEVSMLDTLLAANLFRAIPTSAHVLLVGDRYQLPSVGAGQVLKDLMDSGLYPTTVLQQIFRQRKQSGIVLAAHAILDGQRNIPAKAAASPQELDKRLDFCYIPSTDPEQCMRHVLTLLQQPQLCGARLKDPLMDIQILAPMHRGSVGIAALNNEAQKALNPTGHGIQLGATTYRVGDKIIQMRNNYDLGIFNGDMGRIVHVDAGAGEVQADFEGREVLYQRSDLTDVNLAYAISIHKSQGSEFPVVIIPLLKQHFLLLQRNLIYTALTRGRRKVILIGDPAAYAMAVQNADSQQRHTGLALLAKHQV